MDDLSGILSAAIAKSIGRFVGSISELPSFSPPEETTLDIAYNMLSGEPTSNQINIVLAEPRYQSLLSSIDCLNKIMDDTPVRLVDQINRHYIDPQAFRDDLEKVFHLLRIADGQRTEGDSAKINGITWQDNYALGRYCGFMGELLNKDNPILSLNLFILKYCCLGIDTMLIHPGGYEEAKQRADPDIDYAPSKDPLENLRQIALLSINHGSSFRICYNMDLKQALNSVLSEKEPSKILIHFSFSGKDLRLIILPDETGDRQMRFGGYVSKAENMDGLERQVETIVTAATMLQEYLDTNLYRATPVYYPEEQSYPSCFFPLGSLPNSAAPVQDIVRILCYGRPSKGTNANPVDKPERELGMNLVAEINIMSGAPIPGGLFNVPEESVIGMEILGDYEKDPIYAKIGRLYTENLNALQDTIGISAGSRKAAREIYGTIKSALRADES